MREQLLIGLYRDNMNDVPSVGQRRVGVKICWGETVWWKRTDLVHLLHPDLS